MWHSKRKRDTQLSHSSGFAPTVSPQRLSEATAKCTPVGVNKKSRQYGSRSLQSSQPKLIKSGHVVVSLSANLARETALCWLDLSSPLTISVEKMSNSTNFNETIRAISSICPNEIILEENRRGSILSTAVASRFASVNTENIATTYLNMSEFDQTRGAELLEKLVRPSTWSPEVVREEFVILAAASALLSYASTRLGTQFLPHSMTFAYNSSAFSSLMTIDPATVQNLELVSCIDSRGIGGNNGCLFGAINNTVTGVGSRLLRANIMAPTTCKETISARLDLLDKFLNSEPMFYCVLENLQLLPDLDKMLSGVVVKDSKMTKKQVTVKNAKQGIESLVCLKTVLQVLPGLVKVLKTEGGLTARESGDCSDDDGNSDVAHDSTHAKANIEGTESLDLLTAIVDALSHPDLSTILETVTSIFTKSTAYSKNAHAMQHQECFALRPNTDGMMDVFRKAFLSNIDDIYNLADSYSSEHNLPVAVKRTAQRGYYLQIPAEYQNSLPDVFILPVKKGKMIDCTTEQVFSLSSRSMENVADLLLLTSQKIQSTLEICRQHYEALASMSDAIALLDMVHSFSDCVVSSRKMWCRPNISSASASLAIREGRYPIEIDSLVESGVGKPFVSNDTFASPLANFTLVTGINGGGKSTYLKQIGLITVLAQIGSYVPAEEAYIPIRDLLCTRIGSGDDFEHNISSFMMECKETAYICKRVTNKSLVLIDELGRATSNEDGVSLAWSIAEYLLSSPAYTFFVTHYSGLHQLQELYGNVNSVSFGKTVRNQSTEKMKLLYDHKLVSGSCNIGNSYGIDMAELSGWPTDVVEVARSVRKTIVGKIGGDGAVRLNTGLAVKETKVVDLIEQVARRLSHFIGDGGSKVSDDAAREYLGDLMERISSSSSSSFSSSESEKVDVDGGGPGPEASKTNYQEIIEYINAM